jgi:hypothetical protein
VLFCSDRARCRPDRQKRSFIQALLYDRMGDVKYRWNPLHCIEGLITTSTGLLSSSTRCPKPVWRTLRHVHSPKAAHSARCWSRGLCHQRCSAELSSAQLSWMAVLLVSVTVSSHTSWNSAESQLRALQSFKSKAFLYKRLAARVSCPCTHHAPKRVVERAQDARQPLQRTAAQLIVPSQQHVVQAGCSGHKGRTKASS